MMDNAAMSGLSRESSDFKLKERDGEGTKSSGGTMGSLPCAVTNQLITLRWSRRVVCEVVTGDGGAVKVDAVGS